MAPINGNKRSRPRANTEEFEVSEVEVASSHLRHRHDVRKRVRLSTAEELSDDASIPSTVLDDYNDDDRSMTYGLDHNGEAEEEYNPDMDDETAVRMFTEATKRRGNQDNHPADNAIVEEITCTNFMCHAHLSISIGPLINFIIGHNGSGKSAVLTALTLCLGGKATATNRGQSLKSFIKEGKDAASLSVKIKNQGDSAYKPEMYGPSIIVERHFSRSGTSGFKIKSANGKLVTTKKSDLEDILDAMALQMDNPMNVLTQDMARQFLNSSSGHDKYKFFYRGTQLEQLDSDYRILSESVDGNMTQMYNLKDARTAAKQALDAAEKKLEMVNRQETLFDTINKYSRQMAWAQVEEQENMLASIDNDLQASEETIQQRMQQAEESGAKLEEAERAVEEAKQVVQHLEEELAPKKEEKNRISGMFKENYDELLNIHSQQRDINGELKSARTNIATVTQNIEAEREKLSSADDGRHIQKMEDIQVAKDELRAIQDRQRAHSAESRNFDKADVEAKAAVERLKPAVNEKANQVQNCEDKLRHLSRRGNWQAAFDKTLPNLLRAIEGETRFREKPVGPLGRHVALLKPEWSSILEKQFGASLDGFAVTSKPDQSLLSELMRRTGYNGRIFLGDSRRLDSSKIEPAAGLVTWMRVLKIDNDLVRNQLIINQGIDQTVLIPKRRDALEWMREGRAENVRQIFTMHDVKPGEGHRFAFTGSGAETSSPIASWRSLPRMQTDIESQIAIEKETLAMLKREHEEAQRAYRDTQNEARQASQAIQLHKKEAQQFNVKIQRQEDKIARLQDELEAETPQTGMLDNLEEQLKEHKDTERMHSNAYRDTVIERDKLNAQQRELKDQMSIADTEIEEAETRIKKAKIREQRLDEKRYAFTLAKNEAYSEVDDAKKRREQIQIDRDHQQSVITEYSEKASVVSARVAVDPGETSDSLDKRLTALHKQLERAQRELGGNKEELMLNAANAKALYEEKNRAFNDHQVLVQTLGAALTNRQTRWAKFRDLIVMRAKSQFMYLLSERQFRGQINIDHAQKELDIQVQPDITRKSDKGRQTKTLSGGEKSFSTICLLLSLWDAMGSPIRCLDEFDVFMDNVNRDVSMKMMIHAARRAVSRQFILITPQSMGNVSLDTDVKIHKMRDPERGQTTLPFGRT